MILKVLLIIISIALSFGGKIKNRIPKSALSAPPSAATVVPRKPGELVSTVPEARVRIAGQRFIVPGDYVVAEDYGVGLYVGLKYVVR